MNNSTVSFYAHKYYTDKYKSNSSITVFKNTYIFIILQKKYRFYVKKLIL